MTAVAWKLEQSGEWRARTFPCDLRYSSVLSGEFDCLPLKPFTLSAQVGDAYR